MRLGQSQNERKCYGTFRNPKDVGDGRVEAFVERIIVLVHKHSRVLLELKRVREKHRLGYHLLLSVSGEGERRERQTLRGDGRVHTPLHQVLCFIFVVEMVGSG